MQDIAIGRSHSDDNKRLSVWTRMVKQIGIVPALTLILLSIVLGVMGSGGVAFFWIGEKILLPSAERHFKLVDSVVSTNDKIAANAQTQTEIQRANSDHISETRQELREHRAVIERLADVLDTGIKVRLPKAVDDGNQ